VHFVARRAQDDKIADVVVGAPAVDVTHLQDVGDAEAAVRADWWVVLERELPIIDALHTADRATLRGSPLSRPFLGASSSPGGNMAWLSSCIALRPRGLRAIGWLDQLTDGGGR